MPQMLIIATYVFSFFVSIIKPIQVIQTLTQYDAIKAISISQDNKYLFVAGNDNRVSIFENNQKDYGTIQVIADSKSDIQALDNTNSRGYLLVVEHHNKIRLYEQQGGYYKPISLIQVLSDSSFYTFAGALSESLMIAFGKTNGKVFVYSYSNYTVESQQTLDITQSQISSIVLTDDGEYLVIASVGLDIQVWKNNLNTYHFMQKIQYDTHGRRKVYLTQDYQLLVVADNSGNSVFIYSFNIGNYSFQLSSTIDIEAPIYASVNKNKNFLAVSSQKSNTVLYRIDNGNITKQTQFRKSFYHKFSNDGNLLFVGASTPHQLLVITLCQAGYLYNETGRQCIFCNNSQKYYISNRQCLYCNEQEQFLLISGQCLKCGVANCSSCYNSTNSTENETLSCADCLEGNYMFENGCYGCAQEGCQLCISQIVCISCDEDNGFFLQNDNCIKCDIIGCQFCFSLYECDICLSSEQYFLNLDGTCSKCTIQGCQTCLDISGCITCEQTYNLNYNTRLCEKIVSQSLPQYVIGIIVGVIALIIMILLIILFCRNNKKKRQEIYQENNENNDNNKSKNNNKSNKKNQFETSISKLQSYSSREEMMAEKK